MPIYEYRCADCNEIFSRLLRIQDSAEAQACRFCGCNNTEKIVSRFAVRKNLASELAHLDPKYDKMVANAIKNTPEADPHRLLKKMTPYSKGK